MSLIFNNTEVDSVTYNGVEVDEIIFNGIQVYTSGPKPYLKFKATKQFTLKTYSGKNIWDGLMEYSTDANNWLTWDGSEISSSENGLLFLRGTNNTHVSIPLECLTFTLDGTFECEGNIENLLDYQTVQNGLHPPMGSGCFSWLFAYASQLTKAPELPALSLSTACYQALFRECRNLSIAPSLPATTLVSNCYEGMFMYAGITTPPSLPATSLASYCYKNMFYSTPLISAPSLPATTLATQCYSRMFTLCISLTTPPALPATTLADRCYYQMFSSCFKLNAIPALPATTLTDRCYYQMFAFCSSIKLASVSDTTYTQSYRIPVSGEGITSTSAIYNMFMATGGTFKGAPSINTTYYLHKDNIIIPA